MTKISLNYQRLQNGKHREALGFQSQNINNKNTERERETSRIVSIDNGFYNYFLL